MKKTLLLVFLIMTLLVFSCAKQVTKQTVMVQKGHEIVATEKKDTLGYFISFYDTTERGKFVRSFERFVKAYPFRRDTLACGRYFEMKLPPPPLSEARTQKPAVAETLATTPQPAMSTGKRPEPRAGGSITIYTQREFVDHGLSALITEFPFGKGPCGEMAPGNDDGVLDAKRTSDRQIDVTLKDNFVNALGQTLTSFDCVNAWTSFVKSHPAEGSALFRYVKGLDGFVAGREAIISGLMVPDQKTVSIRLEKPDSLAMVRLCSRRLLPKSLKIGLYYAKKENAATLQLFPNPRAGAGKAYLNSCAIKLGKDPNPFLSFSVNRYDAITIVSQKDIYYARQKAADKSSLIAFSADRYFLSCGVPAKDVRVFARKCIDPRDILVNFVKADGAVIPLVETESGETPSADIGTPPQTAPPPAAAAGGPLSVLYRSDDPVSSIIAEKILADFTRAGLPCVLKGAAAEGYETSLMRKDFGVAVGFVDKSVCTDMSERLRLATMWFNDITDERGRIDDAREIPLFSVKQYLLCRKNIAFAGDVFEGIFVEEQ